MDNYVSSKPFLFSGTNFMRRFYLLTVLLLVSFIRTYAQYVQLTGVVTDTENQIMSFADVFVKETQTSLLTDMSGKFSFAALPDKEYTIVVSCFNHIDKEIKLKGNQGHVNIKLEPSTYALDEVVVMAHYDQKISKAVISQQALEHIQPTSVADVLSLIPGGLYQSSTATSFNRISLRQSGTDNSTSLGLAVLADGIPMDNDGMRSSMPGMSSYDEYADRLSVNKGVDLKTLSTDHIQKIEVVKGISSAKIGNLSSGVIETSSKVGQTPLQVRLKTDPFTKLAYAGKGFKLSEKAGYLYTGADYTFLSDDRRDPLNKLSRVTGQLVYNNSFSLAGRPSFIFAKINETYTLNQSKEDELTQDYKEHYEEKYSRTNAAFKWKVTDVAKWMSEAEWICSADYTYDYVDRNRLVQLSMPQPSSLSYTEGESEAIFLPATYYSPFYIENKPLQLLNQLNFESLVQADHMRHRIIYGAEWKYTHNNGDGVVVDMTRPPYPNDNEYVRPRKNSDIPALSIGSAYLEEQFNHQNRLFSLDANVGVRATKMFNLSDEFTNLSKPVAEPRVNVGLSFNVPLKNGKEMKNMLRFGYGQQYKAPTLDYLYPDNVYKDLTVLSAYINKDNAYNHAITNTRIYDVTNYDLKMSHNTKVEVGWDANVEEYGLSVTFFSEHTDDGYTSLTRYNPVNYYRYFDPIEGTIVGKRPEKSDYNAEYYHTFVDIPVVSNSMDVKKRGVEYRLTFPKIVPLKTTVEVNGAYYETKYGSSESVEYFPAFKDDNTPLPYVGIYANADVTKQRIFNTNVWFNTNIPKYKMIFTAMFQFIWLNDNERINGNDYPSAYMDNDGNIHPATDEIIQLIKDEDLTWRHYHLYKEDYYEKQPFSLNVNLKVTKEFSKMIRASVFVNNILDVNPVYYNRYNQTCRSWSKTYFGAEMTFSF